MASFVSIFSTSTGSPNMRLYLQPVGAIAAAHTLLLFVTAALIVRGRAPFLPLSNSPHNPKIIVGLAFVALLGGTPSVIATIVLCKGDWPLVLIAVAKFGMLLWIAFTLFMIQRRKLWANERGAAWFHELLMVVMACIHICERHATPRHATPGRPLTHNSFKFSICVLYFRCALCDSGHSGHSPARRTQLE